MIGAAFASVLAEHRSAFNARVADAQRRYPQFDTQAFSAFLQSAVDDMVVAVDAIDSRRAGPLVQAAFDLALALTGQGLAGGHARSALVALTWSALAPQLGPLLARHPAEVLGLITNAVLHLEKIGTTRPNGWLDEMAAVGPRAATLAQLRVLGQLLAWRAGAAHFRLGALNAAAALPDALALAALDCPLEQSWPALRARMLTDPWWTPRPDDDAGVPGISIGAFTGLGGEFAEPPQVRAHGDGFVVRSAERHFVLAADRHGAVLQGATEAQFDHAPTPASALPLGVVRSGAQLTLGTRTLTLDLPPNTVRLVANAHTLAITSPLTHAIRLVALQ